MKTNIILHIQYFRSYCIWKKSSSIGSLEYDPRKDQRFLKKKSVFKENIKYASFPFLLNYNSTILSML